MERTDMTVKRALVLGGGGVAGIAWETGVLCGIADESPDAAWELLESAVLVGTSAGSAVAAQIGSGLSLEQLFARQVSQTCSEIDPGVGADALTELFVAAITEPNTTTAQKLQGIGAVALSAQTVAAPVRRGIIADRLPSHDWPARTLRITAIDIDTGELTVFDRDSGVELIDAVAASCAVPGAWPPVVIGTHRYMDGGVRSTVNLDVAADCDEAVLLVPTGGGVDGEIAAFAGRVCAVLADDDALRSFGGNPLDPACRLPSAQAGREQGRRQAGAIAQFLAG